MVNPSILAFSTLKNHYLSLWYRNCPFHLCRLIWMILTVTMLMWIQTCKFAYFYIRWYLHLIYCSLSRGKKDHLHWQVCAHWLKRWVYKIFVSKFAYNKINNICRDVFFYISSKVVKRQYSWVWWCHLDRYMPHLDQY